METGDVNKMTDYCHGLKESPWRLMDYFGCVVGRLELVPCASFTVILT